MAITVNGQILRNLPEQVSKNTEDILELQEQSNNQEIRITALEGNAIALATFQDCTFTGTSSFQGPISSNSGFTFSGDGTVGGNFLVTGSSTFTGTVTASGNENIGGNLAVTGNITGRTVGPMENIVDANNHSRFIEIDGDPGSLTGLTISYCKASLSGTHLMVVIAGSVESGITIGNGFIFASFDFPQWVKDKVVPIWGTYYIEAKVFDIYAADWTTEQLNTTFSKSASQKLNVNKLQNITTTKAGSFRIQYDLMID